MSILERSLPPSSLVSFIIDSCTHPTTLIIGGTSTQFVQQWHADHEDNDDEKIDRKTTLLEVAVARHIRVVFVPSVAHLRAFLAAFDPATSSIPPPPSKARRKTRGRLIIYNLLRLHRETSEWSAQGLGATAAVLDETGYRTGMGVCIVEGREGDDGDSVWTEQVPTLSTSARRQLEKAGYPLRMEQVRSALGRWFSFTNELGEEEEEEEEAEEEEEQVMEEETEEKEAEEQQAEEVGEEAREMGEAGETEKQEEMEENEEEVKEEEAEKKADEMEADDGHQEVVMEEVVQVETPPEEVALILPPEDASSPLSSPPSSPLSQRPSPSPPPPSLPPAQPQQPVRTFVKDSEDEDDLSDDDF